MTATPVHIESLGLPGWAEEKTMQAVLKSLNDFSSTTEDLLKDVLREMSAASKTTATTAATASKLAAVAAAAAPEVGPRSGGGKNKEETWWSTIIKNTGRGLARLGTQFTNQARSMGPIGDAAMGLADTLDEAAGKIENKWLKAGSGLLGMAVGAAGGIGGMVYKIFEDYVNVFKDMYDVGLTQIRTTHDLNKNLRELTMTSDQFNKVMVKYSRSMRLYGEDSLARLGGASSGLSRRFAELGLPISEASEYTAEWLDRQRLMGMFERLDEQRHRQAMMTNIENLTKFSQMLGVSRKELEAAQRKMVEDPSIRILMSQLGAQGRETIDKVTAYLTGLGAEAEPIVDLFQRAAAAAHPMMVLGQEAQGALMAVPKGMHAFQEGVLAFRRNAPTEEVMKHMRDMIEAFAEEPEKLATILGYLPEEMRRSVAGLAVAGRSQAEIEARLDAEAAEMVRKGEAESHEEARKMIEQRRLVEANRMQQEGAMLHNAMNQMRQTVAGGVLAFIARLGGKAGSDDSLAGAIGKVSGVIKMFADWFGGVVEDLNNGTSWGQMIQEHVWTPIKNVIVGEDGTGGLWRMMTDWIGGLIPEWARSFWKMGVDSMDRLSSAINRLVDRFSFSWLGGPVESTQGSRRRARSGGRSRDSSLPQSQSEIDRGKGFMTSGNVNFQDLRQLYQRLPEPMRADLGDEFYRGIGGTQIHDTSSIAELITILEQRQRDQESSADEALRVQAVLLRDVIDELRKLNRQPGIQQGTN